MTQPTIQHRKITYRIVALDTCLDLAAGIGRAGRKWHSHVLSPGCDHNPFVDQYALVIEDDGDGIAYVAPSQGFPEADKDLVKILHGDDILDAKAVAPGGSGAGSALLRRVRDLDARRVAWHHHMHFPGCVLSAHRGKWAISIESGEGSFSEAYADEPIDVLRELEVLYFANLERGA